MSGLEQTLATLLGLFLVTAALSLALTPLVRAVARRVGAIDIPDHRRVHSVPTPRWGGVAIFASMLIAVLCMGIANVWVRRSLADVPLKLLALGLGGTGLLLVGMSDDRRSVSPIVKLGVEILAAIVFVSIGGRIKSAFGIDLGYLSMLATVIWIVALINAFNMVDGLDGLAGGLAIMISTTLALVAVRGGEIVPALILASMGGGLLGFLRYNFGPATIFLGDSGSLFVGFLIAALSVEISNKGPAATTILVPILALGLPITELTLTTVRRLLRIVHVVGTGEEKVSYVFRIVGRAALFTPDRDHIHHRLLALGLTSRRAVLVLYAAGLVVNAGAFILAAENRSHQSFVIMALLLATIAGVRALDYDELRPLRNGLLLPLFPLELLKRKSLQAAADLSFAIVSLIAAYCIHFSGDHVPYTNAELAMNSLLVGSLQTALLGLTGLYRKHYLVVGVMDSLVLVRSISCLFLGTWALYEIAGAPLIPGLEVLVLDLCVMAMLLVGSRFSFLLMDCAFDGAKSDKPRVVIHRGRSRSTASHALDRRQLQASPDKP